MLADVFKNFQNMWLDIDELDPAKKNSAPGLAWQAALKKDWQTEMDILLMVEKVLGEDYVTLFTDMLIIHTWQIKMEINNHHILNIGM